MSLRYERTILRGSTGNTVSFRLETIASTDASPAYYTSSLGSITNSGAGNSVRWRAYQNHAFNGAASNASIGSIGTPLVPTDDGVTDPAIGRLYTFALPDAVVEEGDTTASREAVITILDRTSLLFKPTQIIVRIVAAGEVASGVGSGARSRSRDRTR